MGLFSFFKKKNADQHIATDYTRDRSAEVRRQQQYLRDLRAEKKALEYELQVMDLREEVEDLKSQMDEEEEDTTQPQTPEMMLMGMLKDIMLKKNDSAPSAQPQGQEKHLTDAEILDILQKIPNNYKREAKKLDDKDLIPIIQQQALGHFGQSVDDDSIFRIINTIKSLPS